MTKLLSGKCLCGAVAFEAVRDNSKVGACHCGQCRRWSGHFWAGVNADIASLKFKAGEDKVGWHQSSDLVRRGFCKECGSALFWHPNNHTEYAHRISISAGSLDAPSGIRLAEHIFVADKGDYYEIADGLPQKQGF